MKDYTQLEKMYDTQVELKKKRIKLDALLRELETEISMEEIKLGIEKLPF